MVGLVVGVGGLVWGGVVRNACCVWRAGLGEFRVFGCRAGGSCRADVLGTLAFWLAWCSISKGEGASAGWATVGSTRWGVCARACRAGSSCCSYWVVWLVWRPRWGSSASSAKRAQARDSSTIHARLWSITAICWQTPRQKMCMSLILKTIVWISFQAKVCFCWRGVGVSLT